MRHFRLHLPVLFTLFLLGNTVLAQENNRGIFSKIFPGDSLAGFNEDEFKQMAREEGLYGDAYLHFIELRKRFYIDTKYGLKEYFQYPVNPESEEYKEQIRNAAANPFLNGKIIGGGNAINVAPCVNEGFELNNMTGWTYLAGTNFDSYSYPVTTNTIAFPSNTVMIVPTPTTDAIIGGIPNSPFTGSKVLKLGDANPNGSLVKIAQTFPVNANNFLYEFAYLAVSGYSAPHTCSQQPYMRVILKDFVGNILPCPNFTFATPNPTAVCSTTGITTWVSGGSGLSQYYYNPSWQKYSIDLTSYISSTVTIEVIVSDCVPTGHFMYAYFDSNCSALGVTLNNTVTIPAPTSTVNVAGQCAQVATLSAPGGLGPYNWNGPPLSGITNNTNQTISASIAGDYTLSMNPPGSCLPIVRVVKMSFPPPTTITASPSATICTSGSNTITTLSAVGAAQYTWQPGGSTATSVAFSPTTTTVYTLTARTGTCVGDYTFQVTVAPNPNLVVLSSNLSLCPGQTATLTGSGASTYSWAPVGLTGSLVTVTQTATTTYTTIGTSSAGCISTATTAIVQTTLLPASVIQIGGPTGTICPFTPLTFVAINASTFTWMPTGYVGNPAVLTPSATTNYTVIGSSGSCTNSAMFTVTVDPGPSMTITASPTLICPGNSVTITANAPASLGFTWSPVVSNASFIVVSPTVSTTYSVSGINALGCISTYTFAPLIAPIPVLTISPSSPTFCAGSILSLTATGGSSYTWNPGGLTGSVVGVSPASNTTYSIVGSNGTCTNSAQTSVTVVPLPNVTAGSSTASICNGSTLSLNAGGATSYSWSPGGLSGSPVIVSPTLSTTYTVTGLQGSCTNTATVAITVNYGPTLNPVASPTAICPGFVSNLSASGASGYTWNPGALAGANVTVSPAASTVYSVTGSTALGCLNTQTVTLVVNPNPTISISASNASVCAGGSITYTATGASTYTWNPGGLTGSIVTVSPGSTTTYTVAGSNSFGCSTQNTITATIVPIPVVSPSANPSSICIGNTTTLSAGGASSYSWSPGGLSGSPVIVSPTLTTTYTVSGSSAGCTGTAVLLVTVLNGPTLNPVASPTAICPGGSSNLSASGATGYTWNPGGFNTANISVSPGVTTTYSVTGSNAIGCLTTNTLQVVVNPVPTLSLSASSASICAGSSATLTVSGASIYVWNPGALSGSSIVVSPGSSTTYTALGTNSFGCSSQNTIALLVVPIPTIIPSANPNPVCQGNSATLSATGAGNYTWNPGGLTGSLVVVFPAVSTTYSINGSASGCSSSTTILLTVATGPTMNPVASPTAICLGGSSNLSASGATGYTWNPGGLGGSNVVVSPTATTIYSVTGSSALGCLRTQTVQVVVNPLPGFTLSASSLSICAGSSTTLTANGTLNYTWMPGSLSGSMVTVSPGSNTTYTVTGANAFGCTTQNTIAIQVILLPIINATASPAAICAGGSSTLTGSGGTSYTWNPGALPGTTVVVSPTTTITYTVIGSALGCSNTKTVQLVVNPLPPVVASATPVSICPGFSSTLNGTGAVSYTWNPGNLTGASVVVSPSLSTNYTVVGSSAAGCTASASTSVNVYPAALILAFVTGPSFICSGSSAVLSASANVVTYTWNPGNLSGITVTVTPPVTTTYTVSGTTSNGCIGQSTTVVNVSPTPTLFVSASPTAICIGNCATLTANGAGSYSWSSGSSSSVALVCPTISSTYSVTGTTGTCSSAPSTIALPVNALPNLSITASSASICSGSSATLSATGASSYTWLPGSSTASSIVVNPGSNTTYTLLGINANGCNNSSLFTLSVSPTPTPVITAPSNTVCSGGSLTLTAGGAGSYTWNPGSITSSVVVVTPTASTTYSLLGQSGACSSSTTMLISMIALPNISAAANPSAVCAGNSTTLSALGGVTYTWLPMNVNGAVVSDSPVGPTTYTVIGQSAAGCLNSASVSIIVIAPPTLTISPTSTAICIGNSVTLTASGAASFTWQPGGQNTASIVSSPTTSSSYTVLGNNGGCVGVKTIQIVVNPLPVVSASISNAVICAGNTVSLSAGGASSYTWQPIAQNGSLVTDNPSVSVVYTVTGTDLNSCVNTASVGVTVNPNPTLTVNSSSPAICEGNSVTLSANGALNYTWNPGALNGSPVSDSPSITTTYTVTGSDLNACSATATLVVTVVPNPTMSISPQSSTVCAGGTVTLTASGAPNFTWAPGGSNTASIVETPSVTTIYTVSGDNAGLCVTSATAEIIVNPLPANVTASVNGIISCAGPTVNMFGSSTSTNVSYFWAGPASFTSAAQNPTAVSIWGNFTLTVTENSTGCLSTVTVNVNTDYSIPSPTLSISSSSITCAIPQVTLNATNTTTNPAFNWAGPGGITGTTQVLTTTLGGVYTVTITDLSSSCTGTASVSISTYTDVVITATILPATCNGTVSNNNGTILVSNFVATDKFDLVSGSTYTGSATYTNATPIATTGVITNTLANPSTTVAYTLRLFDAKGCIKDTTLILNHVECSINPFGIAKSISSIITNTNGSYDVTVKTVVKNYGPVSLSEVKLDENLSAVFASPMSFSVVSPPSVSSGTSQLQVNSAFDGNLESSLTTSNSSIGAGKVDTIVFTVRVDAAGRFGPFSNTIKGTASTAQLPPFTIILADSSQNGLDPDPNNNGNPLDNNEPTVFSFTPRLFFGLTKTGQAIRSDNNSFDFHYSISVHNLGNDTLSNILVKDSLYETAVKSPARYSIKSGPVISGTGNLSANSLYDGRSDTRLIIPGSSKMPPGTKGTISFVINVVTDSVTIYRNSANGTARNSKGTVVSDTSGNGENPDLNNNGVWNEPADNLPTILVVSNPSLFIPEGFSPNGDNVNDLFVIKGLPDGQNEITIYNRWGNKVYHNPDYDNSWDGSTDKGSNKLPQGTYYFVLDMKGSGEKPISGFIVLQY